MSEKLRAKFPSNTHGCRLHGKNSPPRWRLLGSFLTASKPSKRSITAAKRKEKEKKEREKIPKIEKPKGVGHLLVQNHKILPLRTPETKCRKTRF